MRMQSAQDVRLSEFIAASRTEMLRVISSDRVSGPPFFVLKGSLLPYHQ